MTEMLHRGAPWQKEASLPDRHRSTDDASSKAVQQLEVHLIAAVSSLQFPMLLIRNVKSLAETLVKFTFPASAQSALAMTYYP